jgi:hypothetical protein
MDTNNSFELHTWMIARLIETSDSNAIALSYYVIAASYERMITRMKYRVSTSFRNALTNLPDFEFPEQFPPNDASNSNDKNFITHLTKYTVNGYLRLQTPIDKLVKHGSDLYNKETYTDFHSILSELLNLLLSSLGELKDMHHDPKKVKLFETKAKIEFIAMVGTLLRMLVKSQAIRKCLHAIARFLSDRAAGVKAAVDNKTDDNDDELDRKEEEEELYGNVEGDEDELERDGEHDVMEHGGASVKSQSCLKLLNLGIVYFDAILVLQQFVLKQRNDSVNVNINIKVLLLPQSQQESMLPWKTLIQHKTYFPGKPSPSSDQILQFLMSRASSTGSQNTTDNEKPSKKDQKSSKKDQKSSKKDQKSSKKDQKSSKKDQHGPDEVNPESVSAKLRTLQYDLGSGAKSFSDVVGFVNSTVSSMEMLQYASPGSAKYIKRIIDKLQLLASGVYTDKEDLKTEINAILGMLRTLGLNTKLERLLREGSPLDKGVGFKGSLHAEACVAAYCTKHHWFSDVSFFIIMCCSDF